ncbi:molybdate ABC transporter permease subunit [Pseudogracilibacillus auburnensis]|uniref:Molybdenum transport system permease n=1 Tax=Pseudogracilibacillus auburnensis TaxID=1494959 RepID=A0A2V3W539_9BACI|nr:molybdate ABC transporter permease subunit [Pseudogracilibacillus auburnensis]MBO1002051.1 molybdate ABC transporter permease subunit [Pseudogracilibacillus auburnensis]PXW87375.1 molybdate transport system permease protein [Pseudogracilibacillus auburnensis]
MEHINFFPLWLSLKTAGISTVVVFLSGVFLAYIIARKVFVGKSVVEAIFLLPLVLPPTVVGFGLLYLFGKNGIIGKLLMDLFDFQIVFTWYGAVIASIVVSFPLMYQSASAAFQQYDKNIENAALTMGKSRWKVFWTISFPLAWPGLLAGLVLAFARGLGEFGATLMLAGYIPNATDTIPLAIYFAVESGKMDVAKFWVMIIVALGFFAILWLNWWSARNMMKHSR